VETRARSIAKAVSYRVLGSAVTGLIFFILTGKGTLSVGAGILDVILKIGAYFLHERLWNHINYGRAPDKAPEYEI
jgi:adenylylsulfate kinase